MRIKNAYAFTETAQFVKRDITIGGQYIIDGSPDDEEFDATDLYAIPGLIDSHIHGCVGEDFSSTDLEGLHKICNYQVKNGVTTLCPTLVSMDSDSLLKACETIGNFQSGEEEADIVGIYLEGSFISKSKAGSQDPMHIMPPDMGLLSRLQEKSNDLIRIVTIAPEVAGAMDFIKKAAEEDIVVTVGHTEADYKTTMTAFESGASRITHLFNAMPLLHHREPGPIGAAFDSDNIMAEIIPDGVHIHPTIIRIALEMFGEDRLMFVSDSISGGGAPDGSYRLGNIEIDVRGPKATRLDTGQLVGSTVNLMDCLRYAVNEVGLSLETAVRLCSMNPAISLNMFHQLGSITPGKYADIVLLDEELNIKAVIIKGTMTVNNL